MRLNLIVVLLLGAALAQAQSPEEKEIRQTYARIALAAEIGAVHNAIANGNDLAKELANARLEFKLSDFRVGNVADHLNDPYGQFVARPNGQDHLQIATGTWGMERDKRYTYDDVYVTTVWQHGGQVMPVEWDSMKLGHVLDAAHATDGSTVTRFATYSVQVTFQGVTLGTRATWWYGTDKQGKPLVVAADTVTDMAAVASFRDQPVYPYGLLDDPQTRNLPAVVEWLKSAVQDCPGNKHDNCYDAKTGKAGVSREDIDRGAVLPKQTGALDRHEINQPCKGSDCTMYNQPALGKTIPSRINYSGHKTGAHVFQASHSASCTYSGSSGTCASSCQNTPNGALGDFGTSTYTALNVFSHSGRIAQQSGSATNTSGGTSCGSLTGGSVTACGILGCTATVSISGSTNGISLTIGFDPTSIYNDQDSDQTTCASQVAPVIYLGCDPTGTLYAKCMAKASSKVTADWDESTCVCTITYTGGPSPIIIHVGDNHDSGRIELTSAAGGVVFPVRPGYPSQVAWTAAGSKDAFLVLDVNGNGLIDDGAELFGNYTPQPPSATPNGFLALARYDLKEQGGNANGVIDPGDAIYGRLRLWLDDNHDAISQPSELHTLSEMGIQSISLHYQETGYVDSFGSQFRYRAKVIRKGYQAETSFAYDVFLATP